ncbi:9335_t:CDS:1, partial [Acaulospora colombiana]
LQNEGDFRKKLQINNEINKKNEDLIKQTNKNWRLSDVFRGAKGADALLQCKVRLHELK